MPIITYNIMIKKNYLKVNLLTICVIYGAMSNAQASEVLRPLSPETIAKIKLLPKPTCEYAHAWVFNESKQSLIYIDGDWLDMESRTHKSLLNFKGKNVSIGRGHNDNIWFFKSYQTYQGNIDALNSLGLGFTQTSYKNKCEKNHGKNCGKFNAILRVSQTTFHPEKAGLGLGGEETSEELEIIPVTIYDYCVNSDAPFFKRTPIKDKILYPFH